MVAAKFGQVVSLVGLCLLVLTGLGGRRRRYPSRRGAALRRWGQLAGLGLVLAGLLAMWAQK